MSNKFETAYTPERIINEGFRFRIPLYQRPYTWETKQVEQLMQDLLDSYRDDHQKPYYIGIMNIAPTEVDANLMDLIDGQQRFTTLSIMALILKDFCENWKDFCGKLDFYGREEDKRFLENGLGAQNITAKMIEAKSAVENYVNKIKSGEIKTDLQLFAKYVFLHASFFFSEIPQDYSIIDKNNQFVRMNNRGKQLEMVDILKVKLLDVLNKDEENSNDTFLQEWNKYSQMNCDSEKELNYEEKTIEMILKEDNEGKEETGKEIYHESIVSFEEFLLIALQRYI